jgi:hypothetical protein
MEHKSNIQTSFQHLSPDEFESLVASVWSAMGWTTEITSSTQDRGIDIIAQKSGVVSEKLVIQAKCYSDENNVGRPEIQQYNTLKQQEQDADTVIVVTSSGFTAEALSLKDDLDVKYVDGEELAEAVIEYLPKNEILRFFGKSGKTSAQANTDSKETIELKAETKPERDLEERYIEYFDRLNEDIDKEKPNRILYFHLDNDYDKNRTYDLTPPTKQKREYVVKGGMHKIKFLANSPDLWVRFRKTCQKYGWDIIQRETIGVGENGFRFNVAPKEADTFCITVDTQKSDKIYAMRQAKISSMILKNIFDEKLSGIRVSDGVSGRNVNRHSRIIE